MPSMPKTRIGLPPKIDAPVYRPPFTIPTPSVSINEGVFSNPENDQSLTDVKNAIAGLRQAAEAVQRGAVAIHGNEMKTEPARHAEAFEFGFKVTRPALMSSEPPPRASRPRSPRLKPRSRRHLRSATASRPKFARPSAARRLRSE